jgi:pimeloyl-ACP methyl ester carboxylesterase
MTPLGVAEDLGALCATVGLDRVAVLGISVGAPFALACAIRLPQQVGSLLLSSPMGPWELPETRAGMSRRNRRYYTLARRAPLLSRAACWLWARTALAGLRGDRDRLVRRLSKALPPPDRDVLAEVAADPQRWDRFVDDTAEAFRQGGAGVRADLAVASRPWGFPLRDVTVPTYLWHGAAAQDVPIAAARRLAQTIPTCQATFTDEGHLMGLHHASEAVEAIRRATAA